MRCACWGPAPRRGARMRGWTWVSRIINSIKLRAMLWQLTQNAIAHRPETWWGDLWICLLQRSKFMAHFIERFRFYFFVALQWKRSIVKPVNRPSCQSWKLKFIASFLPFDAVLGSNGCVAWQVLYFQTCFIYGVTGFVFCSGFYV